MSLLLRSRLARNPLSAVIFSQFAPAMKKKYSICGRGSLVVAKTASGRRPLVTLSSRSTGMKFALPTSMLLARSTTRSTKIVSTFGSRRRFTTSSTTEQTSEKDKSHPVPPHRASSSFREEWFPTRSTVIETAFASPWAFRNWLFLISTLVFLGFFNQWIQTSMIAASHVATHQDLMKLARREREDHRALRRLLLTQLMEQRQMHAQLAQVLGFPQPIYPPEVEILIEIDELKSGLDDDDDNSNSGDQLGSDLDLDDVKDRTKRIADAAKDSAKAAKDKLKGAKDRVKVAAEDLMINAKDDSAARVDADKKPSQGWGFKVPFFNSGPAAGAAAAKTFDETVEEPILTPPERN